MLGDDLAAESHRRNIQAELDQKRDDVAKIPVLDIEGGHPKSRAYAGKEGKEQKCGQKQDVPIGRELIINHEKEKNNETNDNIHKGGNHCGGGYDETRKIDLADQVCVVDQAVGRIT